MLNWVKKFRRSSPLPESTVNINQSVEASFSVPEAVGFCVPEVVDIEESVWAPKYGLKGMIDASLQTKFVKQPEPVSSFATLPNSSLTKLMLFGRHALQALSLLNSAPRTGTIIIVRHKLLCSVPEERLESLRVASFGVIGRRRATRLVHIYPLRRNCGLPCWIQVQPCGT